VLDENFSSLVLHPQFHEELRSIEGLVSFLTAEAKTCYMMTVVTDKLKIDVSPFQSFVIGFDVLNVYVNYVLLDGLTRMT